MQRLDYNPLKRASLQSRGKHSLGIIGHLAIDTIIHPNFTVGPSPGGSACAIATASVQFGIETSIHSKIGSDFPREWLSVLNYLGVDISNIQILNKEKSLTVKMKYNEKGDLKGIECNDSPMIELDYQTLPKSECVHICQGKLKNQVELVKRLKGTSGILSISFSELFNDEYSKENFFENMDWGTTDIVFANEQEASAITKENEPEEMVKKFIDGGVKIPVITLGQKGSVVYDGENIHQVEARKVKIIDPTGCGDSYIGGFLAEYMKSRDIQKAAGMGTYLASLTAQKKGSWAALMSDVGVRF